MSDDEQGARTQAGGTPAAVDLTPNRRARLTIGMFLAGPVIWSVHFMVVYLVTEAGCAGEGAGLELFKPPVPTVVTLAATAVAAVACLGVAWWCHRQWRQVRSQPADGHEQTPARLEEYHRAGTLPFAGFLMALLGVVTVLVVGLPALVLPAC